MNDAFGVSKDWWEAPPPKEKRTISRGESAGIGAAAGVGLGAGALYLATRGKVKIKAKPKLKVSAPKNPSTGMRTEPGPTHPVTSGTPAPERVQAKVNHKTVSLKPKGEQRDDIARVAPQGAKYDKALIQRSPDEPVTPTDQLKAMVERDAAAAKARRAARRAQAQIHGKPGKNPRLVQKDYDILANRAKMDIVDELVFKAITGEKGDKRNTKYAIAGGIGYLAGINTGDRIGARMAGTTLKENRRQAGVAMTKFTEAKKANMTPQMASAYHPSLKDITVVNNKVKGTKQILRGATAGAVVGTAAGLGAYAMYRNDKKRRLVAKSDKGMDWKKGALLGAAAGMGAGNIVGVPAAGMAAAMSGKKSSSKAFTRSLTRFNRSPIVLVPAGLGAGLGALAGKGAKDTRIKEAQRAPRAKRVSKAEVQMLAKREAMALL
jgi:hypothetical protein